MCRKIQVPVGEKVTVEWVEDSQIQTSVTLVNGSAVGTEEGEEAALFAQALNTLIEDIGQEKGYKTLRALSESFPDSFVSEGTFYEIEKKRPVFEQQLLGLWKTPTMEFRAHLDESTFVQFLIVQTGVGGLVEELVAPPSTDHVC